MTPTRNQPDSRPLVILGCKLEENQPGPALERRLKAALPYALDGRPIIVTGQHEAPAMAQWLIRHGVNPEAILEENQATSTNENLENSLRLAAPPWLVVTSDFHAPRVKMWAHHHNLDVDVITAATPKHRIPYLYSREVLAFIHSSARMLWRSYRRVRP
ncbi:YdcF family protein [Corynebacterium aquilae]|uniref:DUF218 domain-containing protein n=1 Tax=Corynebacterium aquilae DSM 44791 TaxID=1431546 RepID=A0A1L7CEH4_9CORY|nr:YdcF family protein [Corynebacterium aquilae]APT84173.1 hypothetical protein CAQU_02785 [Corynebacterium aquilae DSM 44791]